MGFLFGESKIQGAERSECLAYLEEELKLMFSQRNEEARFNSVLARYGKSASADSQAAQEMRRAADRLVKTASEILRRRSEMTIRPFVTSGVYAAWQKLYLAHSEYAKAESAAWEAAANKGKPDSKHLRKLFLQSKDLRDKALRKQQKLARRLDIRDDGIEELLATVSAAVTAENWQPAESEVEETTKQEGEL